MYAYKTHGVTERAEQNVIFWRHNVLVAHQK